MTDEKSKTMAERIEPVRREDERMREFDAARPLPPGRLSPRGRLDALLDPDSILELARLAHSQHESVGETTVGDGVIAGFGTVNDLQVAVLCEDAMALTDTDAQVAKNKRLRLIDHAMFRRLPLVYLADGSSAPPPEFSPTDGLLISRMADQRGARDVSERVAPFIAIVLGPCRGQEAALLARADLIIATPEGRVTAADGEWRTAASVADAVAPDDATAIDLARRTLELLTAGPSGPVRSATLEERPLVDDDIECRPDRLLDGIPDAGSLVRLGSGAGIVTGLAAVDGDPVAVVVTGGGAEKALGVHDLNRIDRICAISARFAVPLFVSQNCGGYAADEAGTPEYVRTVGALTERLRTSDAVKITLVTGLGHVLGDYVLGGAGLAFDLTWAWPTASVGLRDTPGHRPGGVEGPWAAADHGLIDDVIKPSETRAWLIQALRLLSRCREIPAEHLDRGLLIYDMV